MTPPFRPNRSIWLAMLAVVVTLSFYARPTYAFSFNDLLNGEEAKPDPNDTIEKNPIGKPVPAFALSPLPGRDKGLSNTDLTAGDISVVSIYASWSPPCRFDIETFKRLSADGGVPIYGIAYKERTPQEALNWLSELGDPYTSVGMDTDGMVGKSFGIYGVPVTFIIDGEGKIAYKQVGPIDAKTLENVILPKIRELKKG
ncbi:DsbE family thiol:disulfide interchange protein [uncultured Thalassospira sp.]|uniref:DsbE family thiol:disulfide interchange protein n=1 Tax=uncultured Thalassospira sp. TaxID=404382 RepID=UPI0030DCAF45